MSSASLSAQIQEVAKTNGKVPVSNVSTLVTALMHGYLDEWTDR